MNIYRLLKNDTQLHLNNSKATNVTYTECDSLETWLTGNACTEASSERYKETETGLDFDTKFKQQQNHPPSTIIKQHFIAHDFCHYFKWSFCVILFKKYEDDNSFVYERLEIPIVLFCSYQT